MLFNFRSLWEGVIVFLIYWSTERMPIQREGTSRLLHTTVQPVSAPPRLQAEC